MSSSRKDARPNGRRKTAPVQLGLTIVFAAMLAGLTVAGFLYGDDVEDLFEGEANAPERVQIQGYWMGMKVGPSEEGGTGVPGVRVLEISEIWGMRASQAGIMPGDVLVSVNGKSVTSLSDLDAAAMKAKSNEGVPVELQRWGQPMSLVIPPSSPMAGLAQPAAPPVPLPAPAAVPAYNPYVQSPGFGFQQNYSLQPVAAPQPPAAPLYYCPQHRVPFAQQDVHPHYRCPMCAAPLAPAR